MTPMAYISTWTAEVSQARKSERPPPGNRDNRKKNLSLHAERVLRCESQDLPEITEITFPTFICYWAWTTWAGNSR